MTSKVNAFVKHMELYPSIHRGVGAHPSRRGKGKAPNDRSVGVPIFVMEESPYSCARKELCANNQPVAILALGIPPRGCYHWY